MRSSTQGFQDSLAGSERMKALGKILAGTCPYRDIQNRVGAAVLVVLLMHLVLPGSSAPLKAHAELNSAAMEVSFTVTVPLLAALGVGHWQNCQERQGQQVQA